jgi:hypothetical protein
LDESGAEVYPSNGYKAVSPSDFLGVGNDKQVVERLGWVAPSIPPHPLTLTLFAAMCGVVLLYSHEQPTYSMNLC